MEPFSVTCETCRARLKVRDASVIGEIHACPKCESMVLIAPPPGWNVDSPAAISSAAPQPAAEFVQVASPSEAAADAFAEAAALATGPRPEPVTSASNAAATATSLPTFGGSSFTSALLSSKLLAACLLGSAVLLIGGFALTTFLGGEVSDKVTPSITTATAAADSQATAAEGSESIVATTGLVDSNEIAHPVEVIAVKPSSEPVHAIDAADENVQEPDRLSVPTTQEVSTEPNDAVTPVAANLDLSNESQAAVEPPAIDMPRAPVLKFDPLDFDPSRISLGTSPASTNSQAQTSIADEPSDEGDAPLPSEDPRPKTLDVLQPPAENPSITVRLGPVVPHAAGPRNTAESLALGIDSFTATEMPLERFVALVSEMAGVPITFDPIACELSGVSPCKAITVNAANVSLGQLLSNTLSKHRLEIVEVGGQVRIALAGGDERSTKTHDVADLMEPGTADAQSVAAIIERFVSPESWQTRSGTGTIQVDGGKLRIEQSKAVHHEIVVFCERLRLARGLRQRTRYPASALAIDSPYRAVDDKLSEQATFTFLPWTNLADVVGHWEEQLGMTILIDWGSLADADLAPFTPIACSAIDRTWSEALHEILEPLGLTWWAIDQDTIQITTPDALSSIQRTGFHLVPESLHKQFAGEDALIESLKKELEGRIDSDRARVVDSIQSQSGGVRLLVRGTAETHRYLTSRFENAGQ